MSYSLNSSKGYMGDYIGGYKKGLLSGILGAQTIAQVFDSHLYHYLWAYLSSSLFWFQRLLYGRRVGSRRSLARLVLYDVGGPPRPVIVV